MDALHDVPEGHEAPVQRRGKGVFAAVGMRGRSVYMTPTGVLLTYIRSISTMRDQLFAGAGCAIAALFLGVGPFLAPAFRKQCLPYVSATKPQIDLVLSVRKR